MDYFEIWLLANSTSEKYLHHPLGKEVITRLAEKSKVLS
jgi:hypothetical protein